MPVFSPSLLPELNLSAPNWNKVSQVTIVGDAYLVDDTSVILPTSDGLLQVSFHPSGLRLRIAGQSSADYEMLLQEPKKLPCLIAHSAQSTVITSDNNELIIQHNPFSFALNCGGRNIQKTPNDGHFVR
ncbi:MAG: alpha-D-xyloside xylohydrolase, partial [Paraglaciecola sp.]